MNFVLVGHLWAREQWIALEDQFSHTTLSQFMKLHGRLQSLAKNGMSISDYMLKVKTFIDNLAATGEIIPEHEVVLYILNSLGLRYVNFVTTFNMTHFGHSMGVLHSHL